jgi:hypothetical protein
MIRSSAGRLFSIPELLQALRIPCCNCATLRLAQEVAKNKNNNCGKEYFFEIRPAGGEHLSIIRPFPGKLANLKSLRGFGKSARSAPNVAGRFAGSPELDPVFQMSCHWAKLFATNRWADCSSATDHFQRKTIAKFGVFFIEASVETATACFVS